MRCDVIAQGIVQAGEQLNLKIPIVVRLQGEPQFDNCSVTFVLNIMPEPYKPDGACKQSSKRAAVASSAVFLSTLSFPAASVTLISHQSSLGLLPSVST